MEKAEKTDFLKVSFDLDPITEIKKRILFPGLNIKKIDFKIKNGFFYKFTFDTLFEYFGKRESLLNEIYTFKGKITKGNLSNYIVLEGNKEEIEIPNFKNSYFLAKEELKKIIQEKINNLSKMLRIDFENRKEKIEENFILETKEFQNSLKEISEKLMEFVKKGDLEKIAEQKKLIGSLKEKLNFEDLEKDKLRAIQLESQKHILNVNNKLQKTTIIYYPIYIFEIQIEENGLKKCFIVEFDPIVKESPGITCENCSNKVKEIFICGSGHATCKNCLKICGLCKGKFCEKCLKNICEICLKKICRDCSIRCFRCLKLICKNHTRKNKISGQIHCSLCLKRCERCGEQKDQDTFKVSKKTNAEICEKCFRNEMQGKVLEGVFD